DRRAFGATVRPGGVRDGSSYSQRYDCLLHPCLAFQERVSTVELPRCPGGRTRPDSRSPLALAEPESTVSGGSETEPFCDFDSERQVLCVRFPKPLRTP